MSVLGTASLLASPVQADTLKLDAKASSAAAGMPGRGLSMAQVERRYGAPLEKLPTAGGDAPRHPPINRWRYQGYTVYFERNRVIHSVRDSVVAAAPKS
ncbi:MAG: hypothetical protein J7520_10650 [Dokdonella sp.]|nr:hypothetical protein [Dokdonella sp.]